MREPAGPRIESHIAPQGAGAERSLVERALAPGAAGPAPAHPRRRGGRPGLAGLAGRVHGADGAAAVAGQFPARDGLGLLRPRVRCTPRRGAPGGPRPPADRVRHPGGQPHRPHPAVRLRPDRRGTSADGGRAAARRRGRADARAPTADNGGRVPEDRSVSPAPKSFRPGGGLPPTKVMPAAPNGPVTWRLVPESWRVVPTGAWTADRPAHTATRRAEHGSYNYGRDCGILPEGF